MYSSPYRGLADVQALQIGEQVGSVAAQGGVTAAVAGGLLPATVIPFAGPVIAGLAILASFIFKPDTKKLATTAEVNQVEVALKQNLAAYRQVRTMAAQAQALRNFDDGWQTVVNFCSQSQYGSAGKNCIGDRQRGGKWDWFVYYRDPIANDTPVDAVSAGSVGSLVSSIGGGSNSLWLIAGLALLAFGLSGGGR